MPNYEDLLREYQANQQLEKSGSVMSSSKMGEMERRKSQGPLMSTVMDVLGGAFDPMNVGLGASGASHAVIPPSVWKTAAPEAKAALNVLADKAPNMFQKIMKSTSEIYPALDQTPGVYGSMMMHKTPPRLSNILGQDMTRGILRVNPETIQKLGTGPNPLLDTVLHETQHALNFPRVGATSPEDAGTIGMLLHDVLRGQPDIGSLTQAHGKYLNLTKPFDAAKEVGYYTPKETLAEHLQRTMMDEGLASLSEQTVGGRKGMLTDLAKKLGVGE